MDQINKVYVKSFSLNVLTWIAFILGLHDILHAIVMRISSVKTGSVVSRKSPSPVFQMEQQLIHRAVVHRQATQFALRIADESHAIEKRYIA